MKLMHVTFNRCFDRLLVSWIINEFKECHIFFDFASYFLKPLKLSNISRSTTVILSVPRKKSKSFEINDLFVTLSNNLRTLIQLSEWDRCDKVRQLYHKTRQIKWRATRKVKFAAGFRRTAIGICVGLISYKSAKLRKSLAFNVANFYFVKKLWCCVGGRVKHGNLVL